MKSVIIALAVISCLAAIFIVERWRWNECRQVGHGVLYCLTRD